jgi:hypothetical protein
VGAFRLIFDSIFIEAPYQPILANPDRFLATLEKRIVLAFIAILGVAIINYRVGLVKQSFNLVMRVLLLFLNLNHYIIICQLPPYFM